MALVFVVDDEKAIADTLAVILRRAGFATEVFYTPTEALRRTQACTPDLLLTDVLMPDLDGYSLAYAVKRKCPNCQIVLISGNVTSAQYRCLSAEDAAIGDIVVLAKPIAPATLIAHIRSLLPGSECN